MREEDGQEQRFFGIYIGLCLSVKGTKIEALVPEVLGPLTSNWASACVPIVFGHQEPHLVRPPAPREAVWIMFEAGDPERPIWVGGTA